MSRGVVILNGRLDRLKAIEFCQRAPAGTSVTFVTSKRSSGQNSKMWAMLTEVAAQVEWHGLKLKADDWKLMFLAGLNQEMRLVPNINGNGYVNLGSSTSKLSKEEMSDLIELIYKFGAEHGVEFSDQEGATA